jgi:hypothetical protein
MSSVGILVSLTIMLFAAPACLEDLADDPSRAGAVDGPPVTRSQVVLTADGYARVHWTMTAENRTGVMCGGTFSSYYPVGDRIGVGYKWGGWTELDEFLEKVSQGYATGTGGDVTWETIPFDCVVGVSCTGLVSRAWHLDHKYTLNYDDPEIPRKFQEITHEIEGADLAARKVSGLKKGDVFINRYHTMLFVYETIHGMAMIIDSSFPGVRFRPVSFHDLAADGYSAIGYNNIVDNRDPAGSISNPIELTVGGNDHSIDGNTRDVVSLEFHSYSIAPSVREPGPEMIYELNIREAGTLEASITQFKDEGIDNDIHLLESLEKDAQGMALGCVARGDDRVEAALSEGKYYIVVDGRNNTPGEYTLTVRYRKSKNVLD